MYGYVIPDKNSLRAQDFVLFRAFYCGICCQTGKLFGQLARFTVNYDFTFFTALIFDFLQADLVIEEHTCILNPIRKKATVMPNPILEKIAAANVIFAYGKTIDGVKDREGFKYKLARAALKRGYKKALKIFPEADAALKASLENLSQLEKQNCPSPDRAADCFASLYRDLAVLIVGDKADDNLKGLAYNTGKFVYLSDAIDDLFTDKKKKRYNPFIAAYGTFGSKKEFLDAHPEIIESLAVCANRTAAYYNAMKFTQSASLLKNIIYGGMRTTLSSLALGADRPLKPPKI